ncbi:MAG: hypothetical protein ACK528_07275 [Alphaproteobacteria bacterium]
MFNCKAQLLLACHRQTFSGACEAKDRVCKLMQEHGLPVTAFRQENGFGLRIEGTDQFTAICFEVWHDFYLEALAADVNDSRRAWAIKY